jgi:hypothetical protein
MAIELGPSRQAEQAARRHLLLASRLLRYSDFWEYGEGELLSVEQFSALVDLACLALFHGNPDDKAAGKELNIAAGEVAAARAHPQYESIRSGLEERFRAVAGSRSIKDWAEVLESELSLEMAELALDPGTKGRAKTDAASAFLDRQSAKAGRGDEGGRVLLIPENLVTLIEQAQRVHASWHETHSSRLLPAAVEDDVVDATILLVPEDEEANP